MPSQSPERSRPRDRPRSRERAVDPAASDPLGGTGGAQFERARQDAMSPMKARVCDILCCVTLNVETNLRDMLEALLSFIDAMSSECARPMKRNDTPTSWRRRVPRGTPSAACRPRLSPFTKVQRAPPSRRGRFVRGLGGLRGATTFRECCR